MIHRRYCIVALLLLVGAAAMSCAAEESIDFGSPPSGEAPAFAVPGEDASPDSTIADLTNYCPSNKCPAGHTTCSDSIFPCDVDLKSDPRNCGACGAACPRSSANGGTSFSCADGRCVMTCSGEYADCDGLVETGCEVYTPADQENCGTCGNKCSPDDLCMFSRCGCPAGQTLCFGVGCTRTQEDDKNCGACGNECDPTGDGGASPPNTYLGCRSSTCSKPKCKPGWADCDNDIEKNGCEREVGTDTNCAACDDNCLAQGQTCLKKPFPDSSRFCGCPAGQTFCGSCESPGTIIVQGPDGGTISFPAPTVCIGQCFDLTNDYFNCGACGMACGNDGTGTCEYGSCVKHCPYGRANCDGNPDCEVNSLSDPSNCGGCGIACDALAGQACVNGKCVVEPCDAGAGGTPQ